MEVDLSEELVGEWEPLKVTDRMPFRFILPPMPCRGLRNSAPARKLSLLRCQKVQNQTKRIMLSCAIEL
jgi:hypothetical protein